jgi:hypothetical protein
VRITVKPARDGQAFAIEGTRQRFTGERSVPDTEYYRRAIAKGDLVRVETQPAAAEPAKKGA